MPDAPQPFAWKENRCRHLRINGDRCTMPARHNRDFCPEHEFRRTHVKRAHKHIPALPNRSGIWPLVSFVWAEDHDCILHNLNEIAFAIAHGTIDHRQASSMTSLMRTCLHTLHQKNRAGKSAQHPAEPPVLETVEDENGDAIAPPNHPAPPATPADAPLTGNSPATPAESTVAIQPEEDPYLQALANQRKEFSAEFDATFPPTENIDTRIRIPPSPFGPKSGYSETPSPETP